jgi:hypothetical protein
MAKEKIIQKHPFELHQSHCLKCKTVDISKPATLINCCLDAAKELKDYLNSLAAPVKRKQNAALKRQFSVEADGKCYHASKRKLAEVMRYK